jgi:uncharacterized RDD family membrane protein YckC
MKQDPHLHRFKQMGYAFIAMAVFFAAGAYLFPVEPLSAEFEWVFLTEEEKESFYMVSTIFVVAGAYCLRRPKIMSNRIDYGTKKFD